MLLDKVVDQGEQLGWLPDRSRMVDTRDDGLLSAGKALGRTPREVLPPGVGQLAALALWQAYAISGFATLSSPGVFPMLASGSMLVSALVITREVQARPAARARLSVDILPRRLLLMILLLVAYVLLMPRLGFLAASGLFLLMSLIRLWHRPWWTAAGVTPISLLSVHFLFRELFHVVLPQGPFDRWLAGVF